MSKEVYLKGEKKERAFDLIRKYIAYRMTPEEMVSNLKNNGFDVSERTLRRYKEEIRKISGETLSEIYQNEIVNNTIEDIFTMKELQRQCWQEYNKSKIGTDRLKAMNLLRNTILDKYKLYTKVPLKFRLHQAKSTPFEKFDGFPGADSKTIKK
jgi:hypothetical protein